MLVLAADLQPGDSGSALIDPDGDVVGVVFAIALDRPGVAYALAMSELEAVLAGDLVAAGRHRPLPGLKVRARRDETERGDRCRQSLLPLPNL